MGERVISFGGHRGRPRRWIPAGAGASQLQTEFRAAGISPAYGFLSGYFTPYCTPFTNLIAERLVPFKPASMKLLRRITTLHMGDAGVIAAS